MRKKQMGILWGIALLLCGLGWWIFWGNTALMVHEIPVSGASISQNFAGYRIAQISDLHNAQFGQENEKLLQMLRETTPDLIVMTGDLVDSRHTDLEVSLSFAQQACEIAPTYYVPATTRQEFPIIHSFASPLKRCESWFWKTNLSCWSGRGRPFALWG